MVYQCEYKRFRFRLEILSEFYYSFIKQIIIRKVYFISLIVLLLLFVFSFIFKNLSI